MASTASPAGTPAASRIPRPCPAILAGELSLAIGYADGETDPVLVARILTGMVAELSAWAA